MQIIKNIIIVTIGNCFLGCKRKISKMGLISDLDIVENNINILAYLFLIIKVTGALDIPGHTRVDINYTISLEHILALMELDGNCSQFLRYDCHGSLITFRGQVWTYWVSRDGQKMDYWPGGPADSIGCTCGATKTCDGNLF